MHWRTTRFQIDLSRPQVMGIVNVTPDSFSDGGRFDLAQAAIAQCERLVAEGADILDIGGESTRPGAVALGEEEELARVLPVVVAAVALGVPVSVDTSSVVVMNAVLAQGVDIINDVRALRRPGALDILVRHGAAGVCLMHMRGEPGSMQTQTDYDDVVADVGIFLRDRADAVQAAGVGAERIVVDPGIGFAKTARQNLLLLTRQRELCGMGWPLLAGWSRKSVLGLLTARPAGQRMVASVVAAVLAVQQGASIVRVHDVAETVDALKVLRAVDQCRIHPA